MIRLLTTSHTGKWHQYIKISTSIQLLEYEESKQLVLPVQQAKIIYYPPSAEQMKPKGYNLCQSVDFRVKGV